MEISITGESASRAVLSVRLIDRRGKRLTDLPFAQNGAGGVLDLPLQSIARGDYLIAVEAAENDARSTAYVPVRIK
jgi:hypothetical protein